MKKLLLLAMLLPTIVFGRKFYVSQSGSDSYTTSQAQNPLTPWQTLSKVQSNVANGDSVLFAKGSKFSGTLTLNSKSNVYFGVWGTGADPLFWGTGSTVSSLFTLNSCTNVTFYGWNISDTTISFTDRTVQAKIQNVFVTYSSSTNIVIRKCTMDRIGYGAYFPPFCNNNTVDSCSIGNLRMIRNTPGGDDDYGGVPVQFSSRNCVVTNNYFHDCYAVSYDYGYDGGGVEFFEEGDTVMNNIIKYNTFYDCNGVFEFGSSSGQLRPHTNNVVAYNKIINSSSLVYINNNPNAGYNTRVTNLQLYNNVLVQNIASRTGEANMIAMYTSDSRTGIIVMKNNIMYVTNGANIMRSGQWTGGQLVHTNNVYTLSGGGSLNVTLDATERSTTSQYWVNTTSSNPLDWDFNLLSTAYAVGNGVNVGLTRDFGGNVVSGTPSIGIYQFTSSTSCTSYTYSAWSSCANGIQTRTYTAFPNGCTTTPPSDSILRTCTPPITPCTFTYGTWTTCSSGRQTRSYTSSPTGCTGVPPTDSITRSCAIPTCTFTYGQWGTCVNSVEIRTYTTSPAGCISLPPTDSIQRTCFNGCSFIYSAWSSCRRGLQTRTYTRQPVNCSGVPPIDSVQRVCGTAVISSFYYRASRTSIYINSTKSGTMTVANLLGQTVLVASYSSGGKWISVSSLPPGSYVAYTRDKSITFSR